MRLLMRSAAVTAVAVLAAVAAVQPPATAATPLRFSIDVRDDMSADGVVADDMFDGTYTGMLTAVGVATCSPTGPEIVLADADTGSGNPLVLSTDRACVPYAGHATYVMAWTAVPGVSGVHHVECVWALYRRTCTPRGASMTLPDRG